MFEKGTRARLSAEGRSHSGRRGKHVGRTRIPIDKYLARHGTVMSTPRSMYVRVRWDGNSEKSDQSLHPSFVEKVPDTTKPA